MSQKKYKTKFPVSRIKKIMQSDEEVGKMTHNTPVLISAAVELFIKSIVSRACQEARARKSSRISLSHLKRCICSTEQFDFLKDLVADVPDPTEGSKDAKPSANAKPNASPLLPPNTTIGPLPVVTNNFSTNPTPHINNNFPAPPPPPITHYQTTIPNTGTMNYHPSIMTQNFHPQQVPMVPSQTPYQFPYEFNPPQHYRPHPSAIPPYQTTQWSYHPGPNGQHGP